MKTLTTSLSRYALASLAAWALFAALTAGVQGNIYGAEVGPWQVVKHVKAP